MKLQSLVMFAAVMLVSAPPHAGAQEMPKPSPEMAKLDFMEGSWTCEGKMYATPMGPEGKMQSTAQIKDDLGGFWQTGTITGTMADMPPFHGKFHTTYDPAGKRFVMLWVDNMGGWSQMTSSGFQGDRLIYEGDTHMPGQKPMPTRDTFTRGADGTITRKGEAQMDGKWMTIAEETCRKK